MSHSETSYFTLRPCDKQIGTTDPKPESQKHTSDANYLNDLDVPSLPPLSHLLTTEDNNNDINAVGPTAQQGTTTNATNSVESSPVSTATSTSPTFSVAQALMDQEQQEKQLFTDTAHSLSMTSSTAAAMSAITDSLGIMAPNAMHQTPVTTAPLNMLADPTSAAAAAAMYLTPSQSDNTNTNTSTSAAAAAAAAAASLLASNPMLPPTTGHPSSFYNSPTSIKDNDPSSNNTNAGLASLMLPPNNPQETMEKNYSFVSIPGANQRKRPRRRYDEIERLYHCTWPGCTKSYGTLNHLNAHVSMQKHGEKRHPAEFKEMRRNWRRQKKEREVAKKAAEKECLNSTGMANTTMATAPALGPMMPSLQPYNTYAPFPMYTSLPQNMASIGAFY